MESYAELRTYRNLRMLNCELDQFKEILIEMKDVLVEIKEELKEINGKLDKGISTNPNYV